MENGNGFDVLEDKVRKATELVKKLRKENEKLQAEIGELRPRLEKTEKQLADAEKKKGASAEDAKRVEELSAELAAVRKDKDEVRKRIAKLVDVLESLEG